ncbi:MAG: biotin transporter BioY [Bacteroidota bacterium]
MSTSPPAGAVHPPAVPRPAVITQALWIGAFALLTAAGAQIQVPSTPVPYTLQTLFVLLAGALLGPRNGALSQILYLASGAAGLPVFALWGFGPAHLLGPTGGYLLAFPAAAALTGWLVGRGSSAGWTYLSMGAGLLVIFLSGTVQLYAVLLRDWAAAFSTGFVAFSWWDLVKLFAAAGVYRALAHTRRVRQTP